jgi:hypothetical protein
VSSCQHRGCNCSPADVERQGRVFCGERCAEMETTGQHEAACPCGHRECGKKS